MYDLQKKRVLYAGHTLTIKQSYKLTALFVVLRKSIRISFTNLFKSMDATFSLHIASHETLLYFLWTNDMNLNFICSHECVHIKTKKFLLAVLDFVSGVSWASQEKLAKKCNCPMRLILK